MRENWRAEELLKQQPPTPFQFSSQNEKKVRAEHTVNRRIENALAEFKVKSTKREMDFLEGATRNRAADNDPSRTQIPEADRQRLKEAYRRAADRRKSPDHDRDRGREGR